MPQYVLTLAGCPSNLKSMELKRGHSFKKQCYIS